MAQQPRALVLAEDDRIVVIKRLARAVLKFQDNFLDRESSPAGLLCQVWLPEVTGENEVVLKTKGMPFCVAGLGDLLALFRCISCRFAFGTDVKKVSQLGAPGRVFTSSEPELTCNVQKYSKTAYLRKAEAEQCQVQSTLLLPVFLSSQRHGCVGVLEVVQTSEDMRFMEVAALIANVLEKCQLYTCPQSSIERQLSRATTVATVLLPPSVDILRPAQGGSEGSNGRANSTDGVPMADEGVLEQAALGGSTGQVASEGGLPAGAAGGSAAAAAAARAAAAAAAAAGSDDEGYDDDDLESGDEGDEGVAEAGGGARPSRSGARSTGTAGDRPSRRRGKGSGNPGKPGVRLSLEDLQSQFGVGLKEAAARLGICPTTLKRACRRHGIQRWPRRQLMKVNQALDQMEAQAPLGALAQQAQQSQHMRKPMQQLGGGLGGLPAPDTRWTALAQFIPAFQQTLQYNDNLLGFGPGQGGQLGLPGLHQAANGLGGLPGGGWGGGGNGLMGPPLPQPNHAAAAAPPAALPLEGSSRLGGSGPGAAGGRGGGAAAAAASGSPFAPLLPQFAELQADSRLPRGGFQPLGNTVLAAAAARAGQGRAEQPLPPGVLPMPPQGGPGGFGNLPAASGDGPAMSGVSSFGQPPGQGDASAANAAAGPPPRLSAFSRPTAGPGRDGSNSLAALQGLAGGFGTLSNPGPGVTRSWQLPPLPSAVLTSSLDFELARASALADDQMRDDDVGFLDSTVLEMMLQEDAAAKGAAAGTTPRLAGDDPSRATAVSSAAGGSGPSGLKLR